MHTLCSLQFTYTKKRLILSGYGRAPCEGRNCSQEKLVVWNYFAQIRGLIMGSTTSSNTFYSLHVKGEEPNNRSTVVALTVGT
ncbi:hypothetical protein KIN20_007363 [Parelaphostrongylus tenuis]|uniref:Uncharacterized protein n=1 Tax=Parelaphostrongylus tenuis TaxID=148309 RepID=A0AAD5QHT2_PARTN|nr:hypothetical protein KIN20_007363 [Parelaphostrongylus tenuis]